MRFIKYYFFAVSISIIFGCQSHNNSKKSTEDAQSKETQLIEAKLIKKLKIDTTSCFSILDAFLSQSNYKEEVLKRDKTTKKINWSVMEGDITDSFILIKVVTNQFKEPMTMGWLKLDLIENELWDVTYADEDGGPRKKLKCNSALLSLLKNRCSDPKQWFKH